MVKPIAAVVMSSPTRNSARLIAYALTEKDGQAKGDRFVAASGINGCIPEFAEGQFRDNRKRWRKDGTRTVKVQWGTDKVTSQPTYRDVTEGAYVQAYHVIQSFARDGAGALDPDDPDDWEEGHRLGQELARSLAGDHRRALVVTQVDGKTGCVHNHIVIDSIDKATGKSFASSNVKHSVLSRTHDAVLAAQGYEQRNELTSTGWELKEKSEQRGLDKHQKWSAGASPSEPEPFSFAVLKERIRTALEATGYTDFDGYAQVLAEVGVVVEKRGEKGRGLTYQMKRLGADGEYIEPSPSDRRRASRLGRFAMLDHVEEVIQRNAELVKQAAPTRAMTMAQMRPAMASSLDDALAERRSESAEALAAQWEQERRAEEMMAEARRAGFEAVMAPAGPSPESADDGVAVADGSDADGPDAELADKVVLDAWDLQKWRLRTPDRGAMLRDGMGYAEVDAAITAWRALDEPETAWEREQAAGAVEDVAEVSASSTSEVRAAAPYESPLRERRPTREREVPAWEQMIEIDERWRVQLAAGEPLDGALAKGLRSATLERYEDALDASVAFELWRRAAKLAVARRAVEVRQDKALADAMRAEVAAGDHAWDGEPSTLAELRHEATRRELTSREKALKSVREADLEVNHEDGLECPPNAGGVEW
ncbi:relaxase/mobilization nuclease domain-containing protein [Aestuariimicrobium sp. Y1814]|uniref:relaxase/mobilization nuclease domain-containing protein n=1 Tax=Aestuariimicrobium sp. Y1814 TaxID=3418742 RepID=UPI003DA781E4